MTSKYNSSDYEEILANSTKKKVVEEPQKNLFVEEDLSDEDRELRNKRFTEKFNSIADSRLVTHNEVENDYQEDLSSLHSFYEESENESYNDEENSEKYVEFDEEENYYFPNNSRNPQEEYIEKEDYYESKEQENIKINSYRQKERFETTSQTNYIKINKAKFIFGLALLILMLLEISTFLIVLKNSDTYFTNDQGLFIVAYIITFIVALTFILPFFINPNKRKLNKFRFGYSISIGILSFLVLTTLTYAINTFIGFDITNFNYFIAKLLLPIILAFNFIIGPVIYKIITLNKNLY